MDIRSGGYSRAQINNFRTSDWEEQLIWDSLVDTVWAEHVVYDVFLTDSYRASPDPYTNQLTLQDSTVVPGSTPSTIYGWTSKTYTDVRPDAIDQILCDLKYDTSGGIIRFKVSVDGGANYTVVLDTGLAVDLRTQEIPISNIGNDVIFKVEIETDVSGNGGSIHYCDIIF